MYPPSAAVFDIDSTAVVDRSAACRDRRHRHRRQVYSYIGAFSDDEIVYDSGQNIDREGWHDKFLPRVE
jgi:hypothetical protein